MLTIDEQALTLLLQAQSIKQIELRQAGRGFGVFVSMDRAGETPATAMLITSRMKHQRQKKPRTWASVDSCVQFLKSKAADLPAIKIHVNEGGADTKTSAQHPQ